MTDLSKFASVKMLNEFKEKYIDIPKESVELMDAKISVLTPEELRQLDKLKDRVLDGEILYSTMMGIIYSHAVFVQGVITYKKQLISNGVIDKDVKVLDEYFPSDLEVPMQALVRLFDFYKAKDGDIITSDQSVQALLKLISVIDE